jgi:hypothetical protein
MISHIMYIIRKLKQIPSRNYPSDVVHVPIYSADLKFSRSLYVCGYECVRLLTIYI